MGFPHLPFSPWERTLLSLNENKCIIAYHGLNVKGVYEINNLVISRGFA